MSGKRLVGSGGAEVGGASGTPAGAAAAAAATLRVVNFLVMCEYEAEGAEIPREPRGMGDAKDMVSGMAVVLPREPHRTPCIVCMIGLKNGWRQYCGINADFVQSRPN